MGYQFFRKNVYARRGAHKWRSKRRNPSLFNIRDEMVRAPHACSHVAEPREPRVLFGRSPIESFALASTRADQAVDQRGHKLRCDSPVVAVGVASWPDTVAEIESDPQKMAEYEHWRALTIAWLADKWGENLQCVVEHLDEPHPHVHWVVTPDLQENRLLQIQSVHPGYEANAASKARGETKREQKQAYKAAMKALQDDYYENVAAHCGLTRLGPRRQRLNREEWTEQQRQAKSLANARASLMADLDKAKAQAKQVIDDRIAKTQAEAQARVTDVTMQMHQRIEAVKQKARQRISEQQKVTTKLESELTLKEEALRSALALLEEYGIGLPSPS
ncbi:hypothetical protein [Bradyrhizobium sp. JYMT SZCCT0180]|uniref:hypothetical protein n=1 Tax=Bradyrhizobium sp. JYMT SZCCT0180 TaxID=2807666 RepID=UPI001BAA1861|nr:hypothetical protein [Bradyrhizobium sp. JYMT SZCCT0180]MBR1215555.1 hypothetical protein [Bradyrhizobium sp. JYMT SZCCT0180]